MAKKEKNRHKLLTYLSDPENDFLCRAAYAVSVLGYKSHSSLYKAFTPLELSDIEAEALEERKRRSSMQRAIIYDSLFKAAKEGNVQAAKEFLDRTEGRPVQKIEQDISVAERSIDELRDRAAELLGIDRTGGNS